MVFSKLPSCGTVTAPQDIHSDDGHSALPQGAVRDSSSPGNPLLLPPPLAGPLHALAPPDTAACVWTVSTTTGGLGSAELWVREGPTTTSPGPFTPEAVFHAVFRVTEVDAGLALALLVTGRCARRDYLLVY